MRGGALLLSFFRIEPTSHLLLNIFRFREFPPYAPLSLHKRNQQRTQKHGACQLLSQMRVGAWYGVPPGDVSARMPRLRVSPQRRTGVHEAKRNTGQVPGP